MEDDFPDGQYTRTLICPWDIFGHRTEIFDDRPSQNWYGADQFWAQVAGVRLLMGGSTSQVLHTDAVGTTLMVTDQTGAASGDITFDPWGNWISGGGSNGDVFGGLEYQINQVLPPSKTRDYSPGLGRWMVPDPAGRMAANRLFWYGASGELLETTDAGSTNHDYIYFAGRRIARYDSGGTVSYLSDDANGSLRTMTDASGNVQCWADYYPFGEPVTGTGCSGDNYQFAGLYADATGEDGGYSAANRRYNDTYFRWFSPDPANAGAGVLNPQSWNMYAYALDNPATNSDPSGLDCVYLSGAGIESIDQSSGEDECTGYWVPGTLTGFSTNGSGDYTFTSLTESSSGELTNHTTTYLSDALNPFAIAVFSSPQLRAASGTINNYIAPALVGFMVAALPPVLESSLEVPGAGLVLEGGAAGASEVKFGNNTNQSYHTFRHVEEAGINKQAAENAIRNDLAGKGASLPQGLTKGQVNVQGRVLEYNAYKFPDGTINVGRITVH